MSRICYWFAAAAASDGEHTEHTTEAAATSTAPTTKAAITALILRMATLSWQPSIRVLKLCTRGYTGDSAKYASAYPSWTIPRPKTQPLVGTGLILQLNIEQAGTTTTTINDATFIHLRVTQRPAGKEFTGIAAADKAPDRTELILVVMTKETTTTGS